MISRQITLNHVKQPITRNPQAGIEVRIKNIGQADVEIGGPTMSLENGWTLPQDGEMCIVLEDNFHIFALSGDGTGLDGGSLLPAMDDADWSIWVDTVGDGTWTPGEYEFVMNFEILGLNGLIKESLATSPKNCLIVQSDDFVNFNINPSFVSPPGTVQVFKLFARSAGSDDEYRFVGGTVAVGITATAKDEPQPGAEPVPTSSQAGIGIIKVLEAS